MPHRVNVYELRGYKSRNDACETTISAFEINVRGLGNYVPSGQSSVERISLRSTLTVFSIISQQYHPQG